MSTQMKEWTPDNEWLKERSWRIVYPSVDPHKARETRQALFQLYHYGPTSRVGDPDFDYGEKNHRAALHQIIEGLDRDDLQAVYNVARLLAIVPRSSDFWASAQAWWEADRVRTEILFQQQGYRKKGGPKPAHSSQVRRKAGKAMPA